MLAIEDLDGSERHSRYARSAMRPGQAAGLRASNTLGRPRRSFCGTLRLLKASPLGSDKGGDSVSVRREGATLAGPRI